jgi:CrcB protein
MINQNPSLLLKQILVIVLGGGLGSLSRFGMSFWIQAIIPNSFFPWGILIVNLAGCFAIGFFVGLLFEYYQFGVILRSLIIIGFLGGFTTFSSFSLDTLTLIQSNEYLLAFFYLLISVAGGVLATFLGLGCIRILF